MMRPRVFLATALLAIATISPESRAAQQPNTPPSPAPVMTVPAGAARIEQTTMGSGPPADVVAGFEGLGETFTGPHAKAVLRNPSDNSLAVGPDHIVATVNSRMAIFSKRGKKFDSTGEVLYGPVNTNNVFRGFGGQCEAL